MVVVVRLWYGCCCADVARVEMLLLLPRPLFEGMLCSSPLYYCALSLICCGAGIVPRTEVLVVLVLGGANGHLDRCIYRFYLVDLVTLLARYFDLLLVVICRW